MAAYMDRISRLKEQVLSRTPEMDLENAYILTEGFRESVGQPHVVQKAYAFRKQCREKTIRINDDELIVGSAGSKQRGGLLSADNCWSILYNELDTINERKYDPFILHDEDRQRFLDEVCPYWEGRSTYEQWIAQIPDEAKALRDNGAIYIDRKSVRGFGEVTAGYKWLLEAGVSGIVAYIEERRAELDIARPGDYERDYYLRSLLMVAEGMVELANRYADLADKMAAECADEKRRAELTEIARICRKVPEFPAGTMQEALQSFYFYQCCLLMEQNAPAYNPGRFDQLIYPYYKADLEAGRLDAEGAQELLDCLWVKFSEPCLFQDAKTAEYAAGYPMFQNLCVGGIDANGQDAVNDLSYMILQATMDVQMYQPSLTVRYSMAKNPNQFLRKVVECISLGTGFPAFHNDDIGIRMMLNKGVPLSEAWDWNPCGCVETNLSGRMRQYTALADINLGSCIELVLNNGVCRKSGALIYDDLAAVSDLTTYADFEKEIKKVISKMVRACVIGSHLIDEICFDRPVPALSLTFRDCIDKGLDYSRGGAKYNVGNGILFIGVADLINSLAAVKYLVYDKKLVSLEKLCEALAADFAGYEDVRELCLKAPKYGNDDSYADDIAAYMFTFMADDIESYSSKFGRMTPGILPVSGNTPMGLEVGALPSGRRAWMPLTEGISPTGGTDVNGPSSVIKSISNIPHGRFVQGTLLNMKVEPDLLNSDFGITQMMAILKTLCSLDVYHVQFNVIDQKKLLDAQKHPEQYRGLLVRVAGYTAYFTELGREVQDEIIARTTQTSFSGPCAACG